MKRFDVGVLAIAVAVLTLLGCAKGVADGAAQTTASSPSASVTSPSASPTPSVTTPSPGPTTPRPTVTGSKSPSAKPSTTQGPVASGPVQQPPLGTKVDCARVACVALTFDDGPGRRTAELVATLTAANTPATFFMLSSVAANNKSGAAAVSSNPHMEVANHTVSHPNLRQLGSSAVQREVATAKQRLEQQTGRTITLFRPPYGAYNKTVTGVAASSGQAIILWDVDTLDWQHRNSAKVVSNAMKSVRPGSIILMHDIHSSTIDSIPNLMKSLNKAGYTMVTVGTLLGTTKPGGVYQSR